MKDLQKFCQAYDAYVKPSTQMHRRVTRFANWQDYADVDIFKSMPVHDVACVEIHMPEDRFRALLEHDKWIQHAGLHDNGHFNNNVTRVSNMIVDHERECRLRHEHPGVQAAWEQYQIMLRMVDSER